MDSAQLMLIGELNREIVALRAENEEFRATVTRQYVEKIGLETLLREAREELDKHVFCEGGKGSSALDTWERINVALGEGEKE